MRQLRLKGFPLLTLHLLVNNTLKNKLFTASECTLISDSRREQYSVISMSSENVKKYSIIYVENP